MQCSDHIRLSKTLSRLLRHGAEEEGLHISADGYVPVDEILRHKSIKSYTLEDIIAVVDTNDKKRFKLSRDSGYLQIKAQQGHSISSVNSESLQPITQKTEAPVVHGTYLKNWPSIKRDGLKRMKRNHIHFALGLPGSCDVTSGIRKSCNVYIYVDLEKALLDGIKFYKSENGVILSPGDANGVLDKKYFLKVVHATHGCDQKNIFEARSTITRYIKWGVTENRAGCLDTNLNMDKSNYHCIICNRNIPLSEKSNHEKGKKHISHQKRRSIEGSSNTTIIVRRNGSPLEKSVYQNFFEQFGVVKNVYIGHDLKKVLVTFANSRGAQSALQARQNLYLKGSTLLITTENHAGQNHQLISKLVDGTVQEKPNRPENPKRLFKVKVPLKPNRPCLPPKPDLPSITAFDLRGDFEQQVMILMQELRLKPHVVESLHFLSEDIQKSLNEKFPGCRVLPFGSIVNGLAILDSDVDCYVELMEQNPYSRASGANTSRYHANPNSQRPDFINIKIAKSVFMSHRQIFSHVFMIPSAKVPIIKFRHIPTGFNVDINFKSAFGVANSSLIRFFLSTDPRLIPLFVLIKYWSKVHGIAALNKFSNYAITLMVIFYLQRLPKPVLPPVNFLQSDPTFDFIKDGWNCGFDNSLDKFPRNHNTFDVLTLLEEFFHFYTNIVLNEVVISPYCGLTVPTDLFKDPISLPGEFHRYVSLLNVNAIKSFTITQTINVQDPFELNRNVTASVSHKVKDHFLGACSIAWLKIQAARKNNCYVKLLYDLMGVEEVHLDPILHTDMFSVKKNYPIQTSERFSKKCISMYCNNVKLLIDNILRKILKCKFTVTLPLVNPSPQNCNPQIEYSCESFYNLWSIRNDYNNKVNGDRTRMDWYISVSEYILDTLFKNQQPTCPLFKFFLDITFNIPQKCVIVDILNVDAPHDMFLEFANFLMTVIDMGMLVTFEN